jgi:hypothetical protein
MFSPFTAANNFFILAITKKKLETSFFEKALKLKKFVRLFGRNSCLKLSVIFQGSEKTALKVDVI